MRKQSFGKVERSPIRVSIGALVLCILALQMETAAAQSKQPCKELRKVKLGVSVAPPNVVHTPVYVARDLGIFANHCIEAEIIEFEGGLSATNLVAVAKGGTMNQSERRQILTLRSPLTH